MAASSDYDLHPGDTPRPEYTIDSDAQADASPYMTLQALDAASRRLHTLSPRAGAPPQSAGHSAPPDPPALIDAFRGAEGRARVDAVRRALAAAVDDWWRSSTLPTDALLRDGLLVLEAGHRLDEAQRTLLARTALARGHGIFTALRHQTDPERVATLVEEAVMADTLTPNGLRALLADDALDPDWIPALQSELRAALGSPATALRAQVALNLISAGFWQAAAAEAPAATVLVSAPRRGRVQIIIAVLLLFALALLWYWTSHAADSGAVIAVPAATHLVSNEGGTLSQVALAGFVMDSTEVTVRAYRACVAAGACKAPQNVDLEALAGALDEHPITNLTWDEAQAYCAAHAMRLPSAAEWEVAAGYAPATRRTYRFPWGATWEPTLVIGGSENAFTTTAAVGARAPRGNSPLGAADMAGNAAEWTATPAAAALDQVLVKGGSYRDQAPAFEVTSAVLLPRTTAAPWLGFRCAASTDTAAP